MKDPRQITPAEFQIMEILWREDVELTVGDALAQLRRQRKVAYTTVMTLLDKMARKKSVNRKRKGKAYYYRPAVTRAEVLSFLVKEFAEAYCGGNGRKLEPFLDGRSKRSSRKLNQPLKPPVETPSSPVQEASPPDFEEMDVALL